eukprot:TRINITY_DN67986_c9_g6_i1.p1 TRINITY_DN67986_c9_g6~~TRINITY_DN67986_c9_g6_i1.p1  ORF type:complete len:105 (+),score=1.72 TRINITY_DN67986_c9_g6_i1:427-741(+)
MYVLWSVCAVSPAPMGSTLVGPRPQDMMGMAGCQHPDISLLLVEMGLVGLVEKTRKLANTGGGCGCTILSENSTSSAPVGSRKKSVNSATSKYWCKTGISWGPR